MSRNIISSGFGVGAEGGADIWVGNGFGLDTGIGAGAGAGAGCMLLLGTCYHSDIIKISHIWVQMP